MARHVPFAFIDVFAREPLTGNPLALVPDADPLDERTMKAIAVEFNLSETTFLVAPSSPAADWRLRSFTPGGVEVFGAGHNAMGAWIWLAETGRLPAEQSDFVQQIGDDLLPVRVSRAEGRPVVIMDQSAPEYGAVVDGASVGLDVVLGLEVADLAGAAKVVSTGAEHLLVPVSDRAAVDRTVPDSAALLTVLRDAGAEGCYVYSLDPLAPEQGSVAYARFFNPTVGIAEDPATGTAAGPLVAALVANGVARDGVAAIVEQGFALGRPSLLSVTVTGPTVRLSGSGVVVADGVLHL